VLGPQRTIIANTSTGTSRLRHLINFEQRHLNQVQRNHSLAVVAQKGLIFLLAGWAAWNWFHVVQSVLRDYSPLPHWDYWRAVTDFEDLKSGHWGVLWNQHNDHRIVFPELAFALDMFGFRGLNVLPLILSFLCYVGCWAVIAWTLASDGALSGSISWVGGLFAGALIAWRGCTTVLAMPFLLQWTLLELSLLLALAFISRVRYGERFGYLSAGIACATVANYTAANGLLIWPILVGAAFLLRLRRDQILILSGSAVVSIGVFFFGYQLSNPNLLRFLLHPVYSVAFLASFLSSPFGYVGHSYVGICFGLVSLTLFATLIAIAFRRNLLSSAPGIVLFGTYLFTVLSAFMVAGVRMDPHDRSFVAAKAARYLILPLVNWAALSVAGLWITYRQERKTSAYLVAAAAAVLVFWRLAKSEPWVNRVDLDFAEQQLAVLSLESGLFEPELLRKIYPDAGFLEANLPVLQRNRLSIYSFRHMGWPEEPLPASLHVVTGRVDPGDITQVRPVQGGLEVMGWASGVRHASYFPKIVFLNDQREVAGFGGMLSGGYSPQLPLLKTPAAIAWVGFVKLTREASSFSTYVLDRRTGTLVQIGTPVPFVRVDSDAAR
jgi:hypothetical protein